MPKEPTADELNAMATQWNNANIAMFDYGKLIQTNPLAYLGHTVTPDKDIGIYKTPLTAEGITVTKPIKGSKNEDAPILSNALKEAGLDPEGKVGQIGLGPQFTGIDKQETKAGDQGNFILEHELMHKGLQRLGNENPLKDMPDELVLRMIGMLQGKSSDKKYLDENSNIRTDNSAMPNIQKLLDQIQNAAKGKLNYLENKKAKK